MKLIRPKQNTSFFESFSDLIFATMAIFVMLLIIFISQVGEGVSQIADSDSSGVSDSESIGGQSCKVNTIKDVFGPAQSFDKNHCRRGKTCRSSCNDILVHGESKGTGIYTIDVDGRGKVTPFKAYCDMETRGGGWTLFAHHQDCTAEVVEVDFVHLENLGVLRSDKWKALRDGVQEGMMFVDEKEKVTFLSVQKLKNANCVNIDVVQNLSLASPGYRSNVIWHAENDCQGKGQDYSIVAIAGSSYKNYTFAGAGLWQFAEQFDEWPYPNTGRYPSASIDHQNELLYFIK